MKNTAKSEEGEGEGEDLSDTSMDDAAYVPSAAEQNEAVGGASEEDSDFADDYDEGDEGDPEDFDDVDEGEDEDTDS